MYPAETVKPSNFFLSGEAKACEDMKSARWAFLFVLHWCKTVRRGSYMDGTPDLKCFLFETVIYQVQYMIVRES